MLSRLSAARLLLPTVMTLVSLAVLVSLGTWQMSRKTWKDALVAQISNRTQAAPATLAAIRDGIAAGRDVEYARVAVRGRFLHEREQFFYAPHQKLGPGFHVVTPFEVAGPPAAIVLVNRGFVREAMRDPKARAAGQATGETTVTGLVRLQGEKGRFTPPNDPARNLWYWRDIPALGAAAAPSRAILPFVIDAEAVPANPGGWPMGGATEVRLPNRHLEYALTWYGLAAALAGVYLIYAWGRLRASRDALTP